jgi:hypothetical protein
MFGVLLTWLFLQNISEKDVENHAICNLLQYNDIPNPGNIKNPQ